MRSLAGALLAEAIGVFCLVFFGCGAIMVDAKSGGPGDVGIALAFGLAIMAMIYAVGHVSGAHLDPAVSLVRSVAPLPAAASGLLLGGAVRRRDRSRGGAARLAG